MNPCRSWWEGVVAGQGTPRAAKAAATACWSSGKPAFIVGTHSCRPVPFTLCRTLKSKSPKRTLTEASPYIDRMYISSLSAVGAVRSWARGPGPSSNSPNVRHSHRGTTWGADECIASSLVVTYINFL